MKAFLSGRTADRCSKGRENAYGHVLYDFAAEQLPKRDKWTLDDIRLAYPFHRLFFSEEAILAARVERSVVTSMGQALYPSIASTIAEGRFSLSNHGIHDRRGG